MCMTRCLDNLISLVNVKNYGIVFYACVFQQYLNGMEIVLVAVWFAVSFWE